MKYGEIVELGRHRLMCGDAAKASDIELLIGSDQIDLILTDPPYGMKCQNKDGAIGGERHNLANNASTKKKLRKGAERYYIGACKYPLLLNDDSSDTARKFYDNVKDLNVTKIIWGGQYFANFLPVSGAWIFWDKLTGNSDFSDGELAWCSRGKRVRKYVFMWNGICREGNYKLNPKPRVHPTQKPVELHAHILEDFSKENDIVLDCFGGSGTTLIACEITNRKCLMMEISPEYCEIIIERYKKLKAEYAI